MAEARPNQPVAERIDIHLERWPNPLFRRRRWITLGAGLLAALFVAVYAVRNDQTIYHSRPVSTSHQLWRNDCGQCHKTAWQPLVRLTSLDNGVRSVREEDCRRCHLQRSDDHHHVKASAGYPDCAVCHKEHEGQRGLSEVADQFCTACHRNLQVKHPGRVSFIAGIESFEQHPPFAIHRTWSQDPNTSGDTLADIPGMAHAARTITEVEERDGQWRLADKAKLKFSHKSHLERHLKRLAPPATDEDAIDEFRKLACADCHQPDAAGHYMQPIVYEDHCSSCHPLKYSGTLLGTGADEGLPHEKAEIVYGVLRERLLSFVKTQPDRDSDDDSKPPRLPNKGPATTKEDWELVESRLRLIETAVFQLPENGEAPKNNACQKCHEVNSAAPQDGLTSRRLFEITPPEIPQRWLLHSRFRHDRHRGMTCVHCHHTADAKEDVLQGRAASITLESDAVRDVLMPAIEICQQCHGDQHRPALAGRARSGCVECHQYHHEQGSPGKLGHLPTDTSPTEPGEFKEQTE